MQSKVTHASSATSEDHVKQVVNATATQVLSDLSQYLSAHFEQTLVAAALSAISMQLSIVIKVFNSQVLSTP